MKNTTPPTLYLSKALLPFAVLLLAVWLLGSLCINTVAYVLTHQRADITIQLYHDLDRIKSERTSGQKPCDAECKRTIDIINTAFKHPKWHDAYTDYQAMPPLPLRLLAPLPLGLQYTAAILEVNAAFTLVESEKSPVDNSPVYDMQIYQDKANVIQEYADGSIHALSQVAGFVGMFWCLFVFMLFKGVMSKNTHSKEEAFHVAVWLSTKHSCLILLLMTAVCMAALLLN